MKNIEKVKSVEIVNGIGNECFFDWSVKKVEVKKFSEIKHSGSYEELEDNKEDHRYVLRVYIDNV